MPDFNKVKVEMEDGVAVVSLNHPEVMNAISVDMLEGLIAALDFIEDRSNGVRCVVLTGAGKGFCAGANLQGANFTRAQLSNADLTGANLDQAIFLNAQTDGCKGCP